MQRLGKLTKLSAFSPLQRLIQSSLQLSNNLQRPQIVVCKATSSESKFLGVIVAALPRIEEKLGSAR